VPDVSDFSRGFAIVCATVATDSCDNERTLARARGLNGMLLLICTLAISCGPADTRQRPVHQALVVLPGAIAEKHTKEYDGSVEYFIDDPYPGSVAIAGIAERMKKLGWSESQDPLALNPTRAPQEDWGHYYEGEAEVYASAKTWKDGTGYFITYFMSYHVEPAGPQATRLEIKAVRMSPETVKGLRKTLEKSAPR
jgi:hypothetical protein